VGSPGVEEREEGGRGKWEIEIALNPGFSASLIEGIRLARQLGMESFIELFFTYYQNWYILIN
jgi:hypothetical protein